ncbi:MAG: DUF378 domain-containing protein [Verrucomicrobiota bacterium]|nr:DUF378 domain-containing protein [Verrucomicrobiota bacterium]
MKNSHLLEMVVAILLIVGGLNWGLIGLFRFDLVTSVFGEMIAHIVFVLVGLSALYRIAMWLKSKSAR